jgi:solute:Na+ symporter, SSS family
VWARLRSNPFASHFLVFLQFKGYGLIAILVIVVVAIVGLVEYCFSDKDILSFFVGGRSFSLLVTTFGMAGQMIDPGALLGGAEFAYKFGFFDGIPVALGYAICLILNGLFLAPHTNNEKVLTLPDVLARRYGPVVETIVSMVGVMTLLIVIAGNLERCARTTSYLWNTGMTGSLWIVASSIWIITVSGGLLSATSLSVAQGGSCWVGFVLTFAYIVTQRYQSASPPSIGFPGTHIPQF